MKKARQYCLYELRIDSDLEWLHFPMPETKLKRLERSIKKDGVMKPLVIWRDRIVDGYKRYRICRRYDIPFPVREVRFESRNEVMEWICDRNLIRYDLTEEYRRYDTGKKYMLECDSMMNAIENTEFTGKPRYKSHIAEQLSDALSVPKSTLIKYGQYANAIDMIRKTQPEFSDMIISGQLRVSIENVIEISKLTPDDLRTYYSIFRRKPRTHITIYDIRHELYWTRYQLAVM